LWSFFMADNGTRVLTSFATHFPLRTKYVLEFLLPALACRYMQGFCRQNLGIKHRCCGGTFFLLFLLFRQPAACRRGVWLNMLSRHLRLSSIILHLQSTSRERIQFATPKMDFSSSPFLGKQQYNVRQEIRLITLANYPRTPSTHSTVSRPPSPS
jgi:hypothetical protein